MESVGAMSHAHGMEVLINVGAVVTGVLTLVVGLFSLASMLFEDLV